jgi:hypothetical protein
MSTDQYFKSIGFYPNSIKIINYSKITIVRYGSYSLLNPRYSKLIERIRALPPPSTKIIKIRDSLIDPRSAPPPDNIKAEQAIKPAKRRGLTIHIPSLPDLKLGYTEKERQAADQRVADRKPKTGYIALIPTVHFSISITHFTWDKHSDDQGSWNTANY